MASKRDYKAEYQRRIANAEKQGRSRSQARGHARSGEAPASAKAKVGGDKFEAALKIYRDTGNQAAAAKARLASGILAPDPNNCLQNQHPDLAA